MYLRAFAAALSLLVSAPAVPQTVSPASQCAPPISVPPTVTTPHATYYSDGEPPQRFAHAPDHPLVIGFGQAEIDALCGVPPCRKIFLGCTKGDQMALPDPYTTDSLTFARVVRHEFAHVNGWPATHGD